MKYIFTNGHILDGTKDMKVLDGHSVLVEDDKITGIVKGNTVPDGFKEINLEGRYLMPGLINMHVHLAGNGKPQKKQRDNEKTVKLLWLLRCSIRNSNLEPIMTGDSIMEQKKVNFLSWPVTWLLEVKISKW